MEDRTAEIMNIYEKRLRLVEDQNGLLENGKRDRAGALVGSVASKPLFLSV